MMSRTVTYRRHLESLRKELTSCAALLRRLAGSGCDAGATTLRTATLPWFIQQHVTALLSGAAMLTPRDAGTGCITGALPPCPLKGEATGAQVPLHISIIGNFMIYQDQFEKKLLQLVAHT